MIISGLTELIISRRSGVFFITDGLKIYIDNFERFTYLISNFNLMLIFI